MIVHKLEPEQYGVLKNLAEGFVPEPETSIALVAKRGDDIVGRVFLLAPIHIEGPWVREDARCGIVGKRLIDRAEIEAKKIGVTKLFAYAADEVMEGYLKRLGFQRESLVVYTKGI